MNLDFNTVSDQPSYFINADFNSSAVTRSAAAMGLESEPRDFSILKVANTHQAKLEKSPFKAEEDKKQRELDKQEDLPDKDVSAVLVAVTRKNRLATDVMQSPMSADEQRTVADQVQNILEGKNLKIGEVSVVTLKFAMPLITNEGEVSNLGYFHLRMKVKNTGQKDYLKYEIEDLDKDFSSIFVESQGADKTFPVRNNSSDAPQVRI